MTVRRWLPPVILLLLIVAAWHAAVRISDIEPFLVPSPVAVAQAAAADLPRLAGATLRTGAAALTGFGTSLLLGTLVAFVFSQSRIVRTSFYPYAVFLQTVPIIAVAPLIINWCGTGFYSVVIVTVVISVFPIIAATTAGLLAVDRDLLDLFRLYGAGWRQVLFGLRLPNAVPYLVTGAKTSSGMAVVGAIVGEFFVGHAIESPGLGFLVLSSNQLLKIDQLFAVVIASALLGISLFGAVAAIGATVLGRWYDLSDPPSG